MISLVVSIEKAEETVSEPTIAASNTDDSFEPTKAQVIEKMLMILPQLLKLWSKKIF